MHRAISRLLRPVGIIRSRHPRRRLYDCGIPVAMETSQVFLAPPAPFMNVRAPFNRAPLSPIGLHRFVVAVTAGSAHPVVVGFTRTRIRLSLAWFGASFDVAVRIHVASGGIRRGGHRLCSRVPVRRFRAFALRLGLHVSSCGSGGMLHRNWLGLVQVPARLISERCDQRHASRSGICCPIESHRIGASL